MIETENTATELFTVDGVLTLLLKIWSNKEIKEIDLSDVLNLPDYTELARSSSILFDLVGRHVLEAVFGPGFLAEKRADTWFFGLSSSFRSAVKAADTKTKTNIFKAIEILSTNPLVKGTVCMPLPGGPTGRWRFQDGDWRLVYEVDEKNKRLTLLSYHQETVKDGEGTSYQI